MKSETAHHSILLVDDNEPGRYATARVIRQAGFAVTEAATGEEALNRAADNPDLMILDIDLPDISGFEVCRKLKADPKTAAIPVLHLSATFLDNESKVQGLDSGADGYLTQPVEPPVLLATINALLRMKRAEEKMARVARQWQATFDTVKDAIWVLDADQRVVRSNRAAEQLFQRPADAMTGRHCWEIVHGTTEPIPNCPIVRMRQSLQRETMELPMGERWFEVTVDPILDAENRLTGAVHFTSDITAHKAAEAEQRRLFEQVERDRRAMVSTLEDQRRAEKSLRESEERLRHVLDGLGAQMFAGLLDLQGRVLLANRPALEAAALRSEEVQNKPVETTYWFTWSEEVSLRLRAAVERAAQGESVRYDEQIRVAEGQLIWLDFSIQPLRDETGSIRFLVPSGLVISERKQAEEALRKSEAIYKTLVASIPQKIFMKDRNFRWVSINENFARDLGIGPEDIVGKVDYDFFPKELADKYRADDERIMKTGQTEELEEKYIQNGMDVWVNTIKTPVRDEKDNVIGVFGIFWDVTERKQLEIERQKFFMLAESSSEFIGMCDLDMNPLYVNPTGRRLVGLPDMEAACRIKVQDYFFPEDRQFIAEEFFPRVLREGHGDVEVRLRHFQTGEPIWVYYYLFSIMDTSSTPIGWATVSRDITGKRQAEEALRRSEKEFRNLAESMPQIVWVTRADGWNTYFNHQWVDYTGLTLEECYGHGWNKPFHPDDQQRAWDAWQNAVNNNGIYSIEARLRRFDGEYRWWLVRGVPLVDENGSIQKWFGTCTDIEEIKQAEAEIKKLNAELEQRVRDRTVLLEASNKELEAFSYSVSHDLRAPLRHISGYVDLLNKRFREALPEKAGHYLHEITDSAKQMGDLIDDLLQFSRTGRQEMRQAEMDMNAVVQEALEKLKPDMKNRNIFWTVAELPRVFGDYSLLKQVWINLLDNAVKYTRYKDEAEIEVGCTREPDHWEFFVRDNGVGFDMQYAHKLFGVFQRLHSPAQFEGTGIGLANVQRIIHKHGGRVWAEGRPDEGAVFYFTIPEKSFDK